MRRTSHSEHLWVYSTARLQGKRFDAYDKDWLDFIVDSRQGKQPWNGYDIIEGGVADDRVIDEVNLVVAFSPVKDFKTMGKSFA